MRTDARVRYTRRVLRQALLQTMSRKPIREITVKEVCQLAEVNRATFYSHYHDCFDLLEHIENEMLAEFRSSLRQVDALDIPALISAIYEMIDKHKDLCELLIYDHADDAVIHKMLTIAHDACIDDWRRAMKKASADQVELMFSCLAAGFLQIVVTEYGKHDRAQIISFASLMVESSLAPYM